VSGLTKECLLEGFADHALLQEEMRGCHLVKGSDQVALTGALEALTADQEVLSVTTHEGNDQDEKKGGDCSITF